MDQLVQDIDNYAALLDFSGFDVSDAPLAPMKIIHTEITRVIDDWLAGEQATFVERVTTIVSEVENCFPERQPGAAERVDVKLNIETILNGL